MRARERDRGMRGMRGKCVGRAKRESTGGEVLGEPEGRRGRAVCIVRETVIYRCDWRVCRGLSVSDCVAVFVSRSRSRCLAVSLSRSFSLAASLSCCLYVSPLSASVCLAAGGLAPQAEWPSTRKGKAKQRAIGARGIAKDKTPKEGRGREDGLVHFVEGCGLSLRRYQQTPCCLSSGTCRFELSAMSSSAGHPAVSAESGAICGGDAPGLAGDGCRADMNGAAGEACGRI
eukprot:1026318-Rhodomonas_salina.2